MAKLGPFWSSESWSLVRGAWERLITHLAVWSVAMLGLLGLGLMLVGLAMVGWLLAVLEDSVEVLEEVEGLGELTFSHSLFQFPNGK